MSLKVKVSRSVHSSCSSFAHTGSCSSDKYNYRLEIFYRATEPPNPTPTPPPPTFPTGQLPKQRLCGSSLESNAHQTFLQIHIHGMRGELIDLSTVSAFQYPLFVQWQAEQLHSWRFFLCRGLSPGTTVCSGPQALDIVTFFRLSSPSHQTCWGQGGGGGGRLTFLDILFDAYIIITRRKCLVA